MITTIEQRRLTETHLRRLEEARDNLRRGAGASPTKLQQLEIDAVIALAEDLGAEIEAFDEFRPE